MESLILSFEATAPIFLLMLLGYLMKKLKVSDKNGFDLINKIDFKVFLPVLLFYNIYKTEISQVFDIKLIVFTVIGILTVFALGYLAVRVATDSNPKRGVMLQGFFRTNFAFLGIPLVSYICGDAGNGLASFMVAIIVPIFNVLAVVALECFRDDGTKIDVIKILKGVIKNPLIIGCIVGVLFLLLGINLPSVVEKAVKDVSSVATPLAIIALGAEFEFSELKGYKKEITIVMLARLVLIPLIVVGLATLLGFRDEALVCLLVAFGGPIAVSSFAMSQQMGGDEKLSAQLIVLSSALCLLTLFAWIFTLSYIGLF